MEFRAALRRCRSLLAAGSLAIVAGTPAVGLAQEADPMASGKLRCNPAADLRCWYLVGGVGEAPRRLAFIARNIDALARGRRKVEFIQVIEQADYPERFVIWQLDIDCGKGSFRVERDRVGHANGTVTDDAIENDQWQAFSAGRYGERAVQPLACGTGEPGGDVALFLGNAYRAPDIVHQFRNVFWAPDGR
ncbi:hypothetical protein LDO31_05550 [Luteimonas sp. XNQY3]|nr:hypothetical protein [Luteimonas sp. XNQY3]MCD9005708.1 hypothetical protein [Luteimonas sp. XNQY3]